MSWQQLNDPGNIENRNAGNGGDLVKHTVYLTVLDYLLARVPWSSMLRIRECHAGRGMYAIPANDLRHGLLECLYEPVLKDIGFSLHDVQRAAHQALDVWPDNANDLAWYSGSAVLNAWRLSHAASGKHLLELYEFAPQTRDILRALFATMDDKLQQVEIRILPEPEDCREFDGEAHIEKHISEWDSRDLVLLDPFAMWRQEEHQQQRDRYRKIFDQLIRAGDNSPSLILFWTWGRAFPIAESDLEGTSKRVRNGYQDLRDQLHKSGRHFIRVSWRWGLQFAMWILIRDTHLSAFSAELQFQCDALRDHLLETGYQTLSSPNIQVVID
jgi:23S rRNA A2030 N6-methylase RlmJ